MLIILIDIKQVFYLLSYYAERYANCYVDDIMTERPKHIPKIKRFGLWKTMVVTSTGFCRSFCDCPRCGAAPI